MLNELERRKTHFCNLVDGSSCQTGSGVPLGGYDNTVYSFYGLIKEIAFVPLPEQSH